MDSIARNILKMKHNSCELYRKWFNAWYMLYLSLNTNYIRDIGSQWNGNEQANQVKLIASA